MLMCISINSYPYQVIESEYSSQVETNPAISVYGGTTITSEGYKTITIYRTLDEVALPFIINLQGFIPEVSV